MHAMSAGLLVLMLGAVLGTATLSGIFGMAGGIILMGIMAWALPVGEAMMLHGVTQTASNGWRTLIHRQHIVWRIYPGYLLGVILATGLFVLATIVPDQATLFIVLGVSPFLMRLLPRNITLDINKRFMPTLSGFTVTILQLLCGVSGPMLDMFYVTTDLTRHQIVASKALTQTIGHMVKIGYFAFFTFNMETTPVVPGWLYLAVIPFAALGAVLGGRILDRLADYNFKRLSGWIVMAVGGVYVVRGLLLLLSN